MDLSSKKKIAAGLVILYAVSLAIFLPTLFQASSNTLITNVINPFNGGNYLWGRMSGIIESNGPISTVNLTYVVPFNLTLPLLVYNEAIANSTGTYYYNTTGFDYLYKHYKIMLPENGSVVNVTAKFFARTTENIINSTLSPYKTNTTKGVYYEMFNTTPPTPFHYSYGTFTAVSETVPNGMYANASAEFSNFNFVAQYLPFNTTLNLSVYATPNIIGIKGHVHFIFKVELRANKTVSSPVEYITYASFYLNNSFISSLQAITTQIPGASSATSPATVQFTTTYQNYILLVGLGLWSNVTTVYVQGISPLTNNGSFRAVVIPPQMTIQTPPFSTTNDPYMVENVTIYAPDDMLNWTSVIPAAGKWNPYSTINQPYTNGPWDYSGNGLTVSLMVGGVTVASEVMNDSLALYADSNVPYGYAYHVSIEFLLSSNDMIMSNGNLIYVFINPSQLANAQIQLLYNDSDYAVQYLFSPVHGNYVVKTTNIMVYTPELYMPTAEPLSTSYFQGQLIDYDYGYDYLVPYVNNATDTVELMHISGDSELVMGITSTHANATLSIYYPNTPIGSLETTIGTIQSVYVKFANGTMERIYLGNSNITTLFTGVTMPQMSPMPPFWNYSFVVSIPGLESILHITPTQALSVLNNSYIIISYYDMVSGQTVTNMTKLYSSTVSLTVGVANDHNFYYAPATPFEDIAVPGDQIFYLVNVNNTLPVTVTLTDASLGATSPSAILSLNTTSIAITYINETGQMVSVTVPNITLTETAPGSGIFTGIFYITLVNSKDQLVPTGYPLNFTYIAVNGVPTKLPVFYIMNTTHPRMYINVTAAGVSAFNYYQLGEIANVMENITPVTYNPIDGELSTTVGSMISGYYYSGYIVLTIYTNQSGHAVYTYEQYFNLSSSSPRFVVAFDLLPLSSILTGHTYYIKMEAIVVPLSYEPDTTIGTQGIVFEGEFYFA
ncbi:hypothetical protein [Acidianus manzaensis]|uniref:Uncharacterized protein n=1 Tax=Acidianus manzaensis TaxID=282676 RepID=A0A1W6JY25_9CREN|nr:hypothetical protein [Acidianus manzaensis]ARM75176.1 hypothetical protein B6F84_03425 [Acidianus manzaensis]